MTLEPGILPDGTVVGDRYRILRLMAQGGMSTVYEVEDSRLPGRLVLKQMREIAADPEGQRQVEEQFTREAETLARLSHVNLPRVTDTFHWRGGRFLVEELVEGDTLEALMERQAPRAEQEVLEWAVQICRALGYLHGQGIVYRDLKPSNVMRTPEGVLRLIDFGIVRSYTLGKSRDTLVMGTPGFAAPEQYGTDQTDPRSDVYSLGVLMHHLLTGHDPAATPFALPPVRDLAPHVSARTELVLLRALDLRPERRFPSAAAMLEVLEGVEPIRLEGERFEFQGPGRAVGEHVAAAVACVVVMAVSLLELASAPYASSLGILYACLFSWLLRSSFVARRDHGGAVVVVDADGIGLEGTQSPTRLTWRDLDEVRYEDLGIGQAPNLVLRAGRQELPLPIGPPRALARLLDAAFVQDAERLGRIVVSHGGLVPDVGEKRYRRQGVR